VNTRAEITQHNAAMADVVIRKEEEKNQKKKPRLVLTRKNLPKIITFDMIISVASGQGVYLDLLQG
jgi:DNA-directed RNA polymerase subunit H (RpoH/RPB5)